MEKNPMRILWIALGAVALVLGTIGIVLPILPTVPFYMLTVFCFAKGSERLHQWFIGTNLYHRHLESFVNDRSMTVGTKVQIIVTVTLLMGFGFFMMKKVPVGRGILAVVWIVHLWYFIFKVDTKTDGKK